MMPKTYPATLFALILALASPFLLFDAATAQATQVRIKAAGELHCGLTTEEPEYSNLDAHGNRAAFDVDLCKAVALALLGPNARFTMTPFPDEPTSLKALRDGKIDLLSTATPRLTNLAGSVIAFARPMLFDFQGLMVNHALNIKSPRDLTGKKICFLVETDIEVNLQAYMRREQINFIPFPFQEEGEMEAAFITNNCAAVSADVTQLAYERISFKNMAKNFEILPDVIAKDPLAPAVRSDDPAWQSLVFAVSDALIAAEEMGINHVNLPEKKKSADTAIQHFLGVTPGVGKPLGIDDAWAARVIEGVGNYKEIFDRDLGAGSPLKLDRAQSRLWTDGGLMYSVYFP